jgi:probable phosphoglycerate mutase
MGSWKGLTVQQLDQREDWRQFNAFRSGTRAPGGELMLEAQTRMIRQIDCVAKKHDGRYIAIVSHGDPLRAALAHFMGIPLDLVLRLEITPASASIVQLNAWSPRILCLNHTGELPL